MVLATGLLSPDHVPDQYRELAKFSFNGRSCIIDPRGEIIAGPAEGETILMAKGTLKSVYAAKVACDVGGHYSRPDLLQLHVNGQPIERIVMKKDERRTSKVQHRMIKKMKLNVQLRMLNDSLIRRWTFNQPKADKCLLALLRRINLWRVRCSICYFLSPLPALSFRPAPCALRLCLQIQYLRTRE